MAGFFYALRREDRELFELIDGQLAVVAPNARPDYGSGPYLALAGAVVGLAVRDLDDPNRSEEARAFLRGEPVDGSPVGFDVDLFAECIGYGGRFER